MRMEKNMIIKRKRARTRINTAGEQEEQEPEKREI